MLVLLVLCCCLSSTRGQKGGHTTEPSAAYQLIKSADILFDRGGTTLPFTWQGMLTNGRLQKTTSSPADGHL